MITQSEIPKSPFIGDSSTESRRQKIKNFFNQTFDKYNHLFDCLNSDGSYYQSPEILRHPLIFYFGHSAVFYINKLVAAKIINSRVNEAFECLFAVGVDEMSWDDLNSNSYDWPTVTEVRKYRNSVREIVNQVIDELPLVGKINWKNPFWIVLMGIEHELIHLETSSVLIRQLDLQYINQDVSGWEICSEFNQSIPTNDFVPVPGNVVKLGISQPSDYYSWDNEYGSDHQAVKAFKASKYLITNAEFLEFITAAGYQNREWWSAEGWKWLQFKKVDCPVFWIADSSQPKGYKLRTMLEEIPLPLDHPVEVNYYEAKAFCRWFSEQNNLEVRLPTEHEWHCLYHQYESQLTEKVNQESNISLKYFASSCPVNKFKHGQLYDVFGNVWQWTETPISPFKGFKVHQAYDDFSIPTFDQQHYLIKGGSWISGGNCARKESRYSFRKHFYQHAGFRIVQSENVIVNKNNIYETDAASSMYLDAHYGENYLNGKKFSVAIVEYASQYWESDHTKNALDLGCAVGRSCFELSRYFDRVVGLDFSTKFIRHAHQLKEIGIVKYPLKVEGDIQEIKEIKLEDLCLKNSGQNVSFFQADACNLASKFSGYDLVLAANLLDRLYNPIAFLEKIGNHINNGGLLVITSPFTWQEEFTAKENWLGGFNQGGQDIFSQEKLQAILLCDFELLDTSANLPFILRETQRKFQYIKPHISIWKKRIG